MFPEQPDPTAPTTSRIPATILRRRPQLAWLSLMQDRLLPEALPRLLTLIRGESNATRSAAFFALAELSYEHEGTGLVILRDSALLSLLTSHARVPSVPLAQLGAAKCLTNLYRLFPSLLLDSDSVARLLIIPSLLRLLQSSLSPATSPAELFLAEESAVTLARLIEVHRDLQRSALEAGVIEVIVSFFKQHCVVHRATYQFQEGLLMERVWAACLLVLAGASCQYHEGRSQVARHLDVIVQSLSHSSESIRSAACRVIQSLSRSVKQLRTSLLDEHVAASLIKVFERIRQVPL